MIECNHPFQHVIGNGVQYCLDCRKVLYGTGQFGQPTEKDQKLANQHKCLPKITKRTSKKEIEHQQVSLDFVSQNSKNRKY